MSTGTRLARRGLLLFVTALFAACASGEGANPDVEPADEAVQITVDNQNFNDATVRALWEGRPAEQMGMVVGSTSRTFTVDRRAGAVRFVVDYVAGRDYVTDQVYVLPGEHIELTLPPAGRIPLIERL